MTDSFWAFISLIIFIAILMIVKVPSLVVRSLDERAKKISDELDEARRLREEAQEVLAHYQRKRVEAEKEAQDIIAQAQHEAEALTREAHIKTAEYVTRRQKLAEQKIAQAEKDVLIAVRNAAVDKAIIAAGKVLEASLDKKRGSLIIKDSLAKVKEFI
ncbi:F0F1 ATP synthase subunit B [Bartonella sp. DGB2]|uniref:F0F1 ATP synthase subunit B n=1 Tax=Bartonella sp. DGB2 TaxID=3388426 RepID=UPI00398FC35A